MKKFVASILLFAGIALGMTFTSCTVHTHRTAPVARTAVVVKPRPVVVAKPRPVVARRTHRNRVIVVRR